MTICQASDLALDQAIYAKSNSISVRLNAGLLCAINVDGDQRLVPTINNCNQAKDSKQCFARAGIRNPPTAWHTSMESEGANAARQKK